MRKIKEKKKKEKEEKEKKEKKEKKKKGYGITNDITYFKASSFLIGPGYASGRDESKSFYYISVLFDVAKNINSPYVDAQGRISPIIRAGYNIALFQGKSEVVGDSRRRRRF